MALAGDEVADGHEPVRARGAAARSRDVGAEVHDARRARRRARGSASRRSPPSWPARAARRAERRAGPRARPARRARGDEARRRRGRRRPAGTPGARAPHGVAGRARRSGRGRGRTANRGAAAQRERQRRRGPGAPACRSCAAAAARGTGRSRRAMPSSSARSGWRSGAISARGVAAAQRRARRDRAVQHEHAHVGAGVARGERLAVRPDAEHRVGGARVVLGDDGDAHHAASACAASVSSGLRRGVTYGRLGEERRAPRRRAASRG